MDFSSRVLSLLPKAWAITTPALSITPGRVLCAYAELPEGYVPQTPHTHVHTHALPEKVK